MPDKPAQDLGKGWALIPADQPAESKPEAQSCFHFATTIRDRIGYIFWEMGQALSSPSVVPLFAIPIAGWAALRLALWVVAPLRRPSAEQERQL
jgi:hypothetical protein